MKSTALILFVLTYILLLAMPKRRAHVALIFAALFVSFNILPLNKVFTTIDWNVILMIGGTMGIVELFIASKMPAYLADLILQKTPDVKWAIIALSLFASLISAFIDNVATVLIVAPIALDIAKKLKISPVSSVIAIGVASNLQGAATLVGDTTSILLGGYANLDFLDFFFHQGRLGIFWVVQAGAIAATIILYFILGKHHEPINAVEITKVNDYIPTYLLLLMIVLLITVSFFPHDIAIMNGLICTILFIIGVVREYFKTKDASTFKNAINSLDYFTITLLMGLFVVVGGLNESGIIHDIGEIFVRLSNNNLFLIYTLIVWASVLFSAFIDNIPYVATMLPVVASIALSMNVDPNVLYFGLLTGATLGGNLTPIGASANITAMGMLKRNGYDVKTSQFMKIGVPYTLAAVIVGYILIWMIWA